MSNDAQQNALVEACEKGDLDKIRKAVSAGADVNERGLNRRRSLAYPMDVAGNVKNGVEVLTLLIELGGDLATSDGYSTVGDAAMDGALSFGRADTVKFLRSKGIAVGPDALIGQCDFGTKKSIAFCLAQGCPPDKPATRGGKGTVLHALASGEVKEAVAFAEDFIKLGAPIDARDAYDRTPLYVAALHGRDDLVRAYLAHGADPAVICDGKSITDAAKNQTIRKLLAGGAAASKASAKPKAKSAAAARLSEADVEAIYHAYQGNFFEGPWADDAQLEKALFAFAKEHHTALHQQAGKSVVALEQLLVDEAEPGTMAVFIAGLPDPAFKSACAALADGLDEMSGAGPKKWAKKLRGV